jgi:hypothetical protein
MQTRHVADGHRLVLLTRTPRYLVLGHQRRENSFGLSPGMERAGGRSSWDKTLSLWLSSCARFYCPPRLRPLDGYKLGFMVGFLEVYILHIPTRLNISAEQRHCSPLQHILWRKSHLDRFCLSVYRLACLSYTLVSLDFFIIFPFNLCMGVIGGEGVKAVGLWRHIDTLASTQPPQKKKLFLG